MGERLIFGNLRVALVREFLKDAIDHDVVVPFLVIHFLVDLVFFFW